MLKALNIASTALRDIVRGGTRLIELSARRNQYQDLHHQASLYGHQSAEALRAMIYLWCSNVDIELPWR